ncbi:MFS transporter [Caballeronia mineralivorans]|uniref:MFS transporter n=1 Tax=Caballeronia mineralivorans TaxID=2010198 RepID=UPI0023F579FF|nr:aromatic acid/H+ symport family MFS transporter [Caballeronia mineralivorans]MDB5788007.1 4-hydroxybenzoate transporter [Caballeronia mineralivorans]MEA3096536.1 transporter, family, 4-hydroxybenzoate transporter [Caballeronia mineralivorans]
MTSPSSIRVDQFIDSHPFSSFQKRVLALCFLVVAIDGFDTAAIGFIGPALREQWHLSAAALAPLFGAGLFGLMAGALLFGPMADRFGRKTILAGSVVVFGAASLASSLSPDLLWLVALRFITGLGLGGAMPNAITLTSEYSPGHRRSGLVTLMFCGFTLGSALGGLVSAQLLADLGWRGILAIGGVAPLLLAPLLLLALPESMRFLLVAKRGRESNQESIGRIAMRIDPRLDPRTYFVAGEAPAKSSVRTLFAPEMIAGTLLLWVTFFMSLLIVYLLSSWMPTLLSGNGISLRKASFMTATFQIGGTVGAICLGHLMDRRDPHRVLSRAYIAAAAFIVMCALGGSSVVTIVIAVFGIGLCVSGGQVGGNALAAAFYPTASRATGVAWANAVGRSGSIAGSLLGGMMMSQNLDFKTIFLMLTAPSLAAAVSLAVLGRVRHQNGAIEASPAIAIGD